MRALLSEGRILERGKYNRGPEPDWEPQLLKWLLTLVVALVLLSALTPWLARVGFGRLPGDICIESERSRVFIPITSMVILSVVLTVLINLFRR